MLIVEELHLLLLRPDGRPEVAAGGYRLYAEIAAAVVDLTLHGRVVLTEEKRPRVQVVSTEPTGDPVLDDLLVRLAPSSGKHLDSLVVSSKFDPLDQVVASLVRQGILARGERGFFGWGAERTPESDPGPEMLLRARLAAVLAGTAAPSQADLALLAILHGLNAAYPLLRHDLGEMKASQVRTRIEALADGSAAGGAVSGAVNAAIMVVMMAVMTPVMVATTMS